MIAISKRRFLCTGGVLMAVVFLIAAVKQGLLAQDLPSSPIGQLIVIPVSAGEVSPSAIWNLTKPPKRGKHYVVVTVKVRNASLYPNCTDITDPHLLTDANHKYGSLIWHAPDAPATDRLPSGATSIGSFAYQVRDGEKVRALLMDRSYDLERECWNRYGFVPTTPFSSSAYLPLANLPIPSATSQAGAADTKH